MIMNMQPPLVCQKTSKGDTPLHTAARLAAPILMQGRNNMNALHPAVIRSQVLKLMEKCQPATSEAYNFGANLGELDIVDQFLSADNSVASLQSKEGMTAVHLATKGHTAVLLAIVATCQDIWDLQDNRGQTALHVAVENQKINVAKVFLDLVSEDLLYQQDNEGNI
ncbi:ankyrin repeat-containing protein, putative [Ricinus communis]|uniref:Ankyrin repeat-containing protein, putative n=1 Tax=Ricinus communis TaxID=3988 RepID=B9S7H7_RICCO|nr:ankyrin repeat-containing protein, putative [Ricinus communis]